MSSKYRLPAVVFVIIVMFYGCKNKIRDDRGALQESVDDKYYVKGNVPGVKSDWMIICYSDRPGKNVKVDSAKINDGKFSFKGRINVLQPVLLGMRHLDKNGRKTFIEYHGPFILERGALNVSYIRDSSDKMIAWGTEGQNRYNEFSKKIDPVLKTMNSIAGQMYNVKKGKKQYIDSLNDAYDECISKISITVREHVIHYPSSVVSAYIVRHFLTNPDSKILRSLYEQFAENVKKSIYGKQLYDELQAKEKMSIGSSAPELNLLDTSNKTVSLRSFRGKWVLLDFWASWCQPCRKENPALIKAYAQFNKKGFEIISISTDENRISWLNAIKQDHLGWTQLNTSKRSATDKFGITAIPMNFLLDGNGKIIASDLRGDALQKKLTEVTQAERPVKNTVNDQY